MIKKILASSLVTAMLLFSGCGDSEGEDYLAIQQMLDKGDYAGVIAALEGSADSKDDYIALGAAYMGKAGVSLTTIISAMAADGGDDSFAAFVKKIAEESSSTSITDLSKSRDFYKHVVGDCTSPDLSASAKDVCLFIGLGAISGSAITIDSLVGDISKFGGSTGPDDKLTATICAVHYNYDDTERTECTIDTTSSDVTFTITNKVYKPIPVTVNDTGYKDYFLQTSEGKTVLTDGYCKATDFSTRVDTYNDITAPYACPIIEDSSLGELTIEEMLVDVFNEGIESVGAALTKDIQEDINEFISEIDTDGDKSINEEEILNYLNSKNG